MKNFRFQDFYIKKTCIKKEKRHIIELLIIINKKNYIKMLINM